jgi:hypothetical protein
MNGLTPWAAREGKHQRRDPGLGFMLARGSQAYAFVCEPDGLAVEILAYIDGEWDLSR